MTTVRRFHGAEYAPGSVGDIFRLIRAGDATSRSSLARSSGLAPSTVSLRVDVLERLGLVGEAGDEQSRGGRRARRLSVETGAGLVGAVDVGAHHARVGIADLGGTLLAVTDVPAVIADGPEVTVERLWHAVVELAAQHPLGHAPLLGLAIGLPAPIEFSTGRVVLPSFMPSWHGADLPRLFAAHTDLPVLVENDANLLALAERSTVHPENDQLLVIKLGTRIGCGIISAGRLHRGVGGGAGEISHTAVDGTSAISCVCGIPNCLESVASGGAIAARLSAQGYQASTAVEVVELARGGDPVVLAELRSAGASIGEVLGSIVNFFNPRDVVLGGALSASAPLVAAVRAELFRRCLPLVTNDLEVRAAQIPEDAGLRGAFHLILEEVLAPARIEQRARELDARPGRTA